MNINVGRKAITEASEKLKNWGRWGKDDQIGTLNHVMPEDIVGRRALIRTGKVFALGIPLDRHGPAERACSAGAGIRSTPCSPPAPMRSRAATTRCPASAIADDAINMPVQAATHWDALGHIFYDDKMYNGFDAREVDCNGLGKLGIEHTKSRMVGPRRAARHRALPRRRLAQGRRGHFQRRARHLRQGGERRDPARRFRHPAHRADGALPGRGELGRLCRR